MDSKVVEWINRTITHPRDDEGDYGIRVLTHIPVGILIGLGLLSEKMFLKYERNEDAHTQDEAWKDIAGSLIGMPVGRGILIGTLIYVLLRWLL